MSTVKSTSAAEHERYIISSDSRIWTCSSGSGVAILFFNGGPGCDDYLQAVAALIEDRCRVIRFEPRGCGRSDWDGNYALYTLLEDAEAICQAYHLEQVILLGQSHGLNVALAFALRYPKRVLGIIGLAGGKVVDSRQWSTLYHERKESIGEDLGSKVFHADPEVNRRGNADWRNYCEQPMLFRQLADLAIPCVFINASEDIRPNWPTQQLAALIPNAQYVEISGAAHTIWLTHAQELQIELQKALAYILSNILSSVR